MNKRYSVKERQRHLNTREKTGLSILEYSKRKKLNPGIVSFCRHIQQMFSFGKFEEVILLGALSGTLIIE